MSRSLGPSTRAAPAKRRHELLYLELEPPEPSRAFRHGCILYGPPTSSSNRPRTSATMSDVSMLRASHQAAPSVFDSTPAPSRYARVLHALAWV